MNIGVITCTYYMDIYDYRVPEPFDWNEMCNKYRLAYSIGDFLTLARKIRQIGFTGIEIWEPMLSYQTLNPDTANRVAGELRGMGFTDIVYCIGGWSKADTEHMEDAYRFAKAMGCKVISGCANKTDASIMFPVLEKLGSMNAIRYAIENHPNPNMSDPLEIAELTAPYRHIGANIDTGIYYSMGYDVINAVHTLKEKICHCHLKDSLRGGEGCYPIGDASVPCVELISLLKKWDYPYMISIEFEYPADPTPGLFKSMGYVNGILKTLDT